MNFDSILEENGDEFANLKDNLVKDYANVLESYMAAIFLDSGNLIWAENIFRIVMNPDFLSYIPILEN